MAVTPFLLLSSVLDTVLPLPDTEGVYEIKLPKALTDEQFFELCRKLPDYQIEQTKNGKLFIIPPVGIESGLYEDEANSELRDWRRAIGKGRTLSPSTGFKLPDGSRHSADGAWVTDEKLEALSAEEIKRFAPLVPDFVIEIRSNSDRIARLKKKMTDVWIKNGVRLAWLIDPVEKKAYVYRQNGTSETIPGFDHVLSGEDVCEGFKLDLSKLNR
jgi:Uma2 family endonuclease